MHRLSPSRESGVLTGHPVIQMIPQQKHNGLWMAPWEEIDMNPASLYLLSDAQPPAAIALL